MAVPVDATLRIEPLGTLPAGHAVKGSNHTQRPENVQALGSVPASLLGCLPKPVQLRGRQLVQRFAGCRRQRLHGGEALLELAAGAAQTRLGIKFQMTREIDAAAACSRR